MRRNGSGGLKSAFRVSKKGQWHSATAYSRRSVRAVADRAGSSGVHDDGSGDVRTGSGFIEILVTRKRQRTQCAVHGQLCSDNYAAESNFSGTARPKFPAKQGI